jgi:hypothetical protein
MTRTIRTICLFLINGFARQAPRSLTLLLAVPLLCSLPLRAQIDTGGISGTVSDSSNAVIRGATVTLLDDATGISTTARSGSTGVYAFNGLNPGSYTITVAPTGFETYVTHGILVHVQQTVTLDIHLTPGSVQQQVTVTAAAPLLQAEDASVGQTIDSKTLNGLPLNGRNWISLAQLSAGVATAPPGSSTSTTSTVDSLQYSVNGVNLYQNDVRLNGIDNNIEFFGGSSITAATITPPPDAVEEFKLQSGDFSAEFGHSTGSIINAVIKSGTNQLHGNLWEYLRNDAFDANDYFSNLFGKPIPEYRQNQFGGTIGGPVLLPKLYDGRNKTFFFFDYQGTRIVTPSSATSTVPTAGMTNSGFTNLRDLITYNSGTRKDALGRTFSLGTILDPATTRAVAAGAIDSITGLRNASAATAYVRDPFYSGGSLAGKTDFTGASAQLNIIPASRIDPNAVNLLSLYPAPNGTGLANNFLNNPKQTETMNTYDIRIDENVSSKDIVFGVFDESYITYVTPGILPGIAVGQSGAQNQSYPAYAIAAGYTHVFTPTLSNEAHFGFARTSKDQRLFVGNMLGIPAQYGIQGIPQVTNNGGLPPITIDGLSPIGVTNDRPTIQTVGDLEVTDNLTKVFGSHTFKMGGQFDSLLGDVLQPPAPKGDFTFSGQYSDIPNQSSGLNGIADLLLVPTNSTVSGGINNLGGLASFYGSNYAGSNYHRYYVGFYFQDDWKPTPKLTLNLGLRWDYFEPYIETAGRQANFIANGGNGPTGTFYIPNKGCSVPRSASFNALLASSNISLDCVSGLTVGSGPGANFAPRVGFAYRALPSLVVRGGYGIAYGALGNLGYQGTLGTNYPFLYTIRLTSPSSQAPLALSNGQTATLENAFTTINLSDPTQVTGTGVALYGRQYNYETPYTQTFNLMIQDQFTKHDSIQAGYVGTVGRHLDNLGSNNSPSEILPPGTNINSYIPYPSFAPNAIYESTNGTSSYNSLQVTYAHELSIGLSMLANYTYSKCFSSQHTEGTATSISSPSYRAQWLPGFGIAGDYGLCDTDATNIIHISGTYALPVGRGKVLLGNTSKLVDLIAGGWSANYIYSYQSGQPFTINCPIATTATSDFGCFADKVPGQNMYAGPHDRTQWLNPNAFSQPAVATAIGQADYSVLGGAPQQARGPGFSNLDSSVFKDFALAEKASLQFRVEAFNTLNTPQFAQPGSLNFTNQTAFSSITGLRNTARLLQFALKLSF